MKILYQIPSLDTIYAGRTIYNGYKNAFVDLGHIFLPFTADDNFKKTLENFNPDIFITSLNPFYLKFIDLDLLNEKRKAGLKVFVNIPFWKSPISKLRINESASLSENKSYIDLIKSGKLGDVYYNICEADDPRMDGFEKTTGQKHCAILLAADKTLNYPEYAEKFKADISYVGTYLPQKMKFIQEQVFPLRKKYDLKLYGQDWTFWDRIRGFVQKVGQYFNIPFVRSLQKPKLKLEDERKIYSSSSISINIHESYQKKFGGDCNERTFKIPLCGGFEITDDVACIRKYFEEGKEIVIAKNKDDWFQKIEYYLKHPEKRLPIIEAGRQKVLSQHTYHNRVEQMISLYNSI